MTLPAQRPATARVLAALAERGDEDRWYAWATAYVLRLSFGWVERETAPGAWSVLSAWRHPDPREALEALQAAVLAPPDDAGRRWWCPRCKGRGHVCCDCAETGARPFDVASDGGTPHPPDLPSLVAVASLGVGDWLRAEALAREVERNAVVVWRVMTAAALRSAFNEALNVALNQGNDVAGVRLVATVANFFPQELPSQLRWWEELLPDRSEAARSVADLAALGVHLIGHEAGRVTLAVEALA